MWKELSRRCECDTEETLDILAEEVIVFVAEMVGEENGSPLYLTVCWTPYMPQFYSFEATGESLFAYLANPDEEDGGALERIRAEQTVFRLEADEEYEGVYAEQFHALVDMINAKAAERGFRIEDYDDSDDLDDL